MTRTPLLTDLWSEANWLEWRSRLDPLHLISSPTLVTTEQSRGEFIEGARLLRLDKRSRAGDGGMGPSPAQLMVADLLAAGVFMNAIDEARRSTKTTAVQAVMLGRCYHREDYQVGWTMFTTGAKAGERFRKDIVAHLRRVYPDERVSPIKINVGKGTEHLEFRDTGSFLNVYTPNGEGFRSGGFDFAFGDEAAEADIEQGEDVERAVIPTMDTKEGAQFVLAGTGAKWRTGNLLWRSLHDPDANVLWHGIPETTEREQLVSWEPDMPHPLTGATGGRMREWIENTHTGVSFTTPVEAVKRSFHKVKLDDFLIEYGGQFGFEGAADTLIPPALWAARRAQHGFPAELPRHLSVALKVHHLGLTASLAVAWEYEEPTTDLVDEAYELDGGRERPRRRAIALWHWQEGTPGLAREVIDKLRKRPGLVLGYDKRGYTEDVVEKEVILANPVPLLRGSVAADIPRSAVALFKAITTGTVVVFGHEKLDAAAARATRQSFGNYGTWRFGAPKDDPDFDVTPLEAAALALHWLEDMPAIQSPDDSF
ncbi:hypothetical protein SAMN04487848_2059 [Microbacterium sp. ru370.1]|uniref:hypothetical protein n=1 Tax=unclassified Microbacterium TaxID=2609290 RepID=UPI00088396C2|nr:MULTISPECIES: hypothetical protein [unclassified Microbacterium]SDO77718.1 hypothetical protein SAMN04487848_2059 [Microbacterium sp. ru370.1]SIT88945.1 hypothetical protein SAMN05880579_2054 [Microbacterium sp. RU1D]